jgi:hypothetical protein
MNTFRHSKPISKADDSAKELIIEALGGENTYGFDVDSIYYFENEDKWVVIEFLKCDHKNVRPSTSHPSRYWKMNWRKFASLWRIVGMLDAEFYLVNYEDQAHANLQGRNAREFHIITVMDMNATEHGGIKSETTQTMDLNGFKNWFKNLNSRGAKIRS